jgi:hypothetical protein
LFTTLKGEIDDASIQPQSLFKTLTASIIPSEKAKFIKRQKLISVEAIDKGNKTIGLIQCFSDCR